MLLADLSKAFERVNPYWIFSPVKDQEGASLVNHLESDPWGAGSTRIC